MAQIDPVTITHSRQDGQISEGISAQVFDRNAAATAFAQSPHMQSVPEELARHRSSNSGRIRQTGVRPAIVAGTSGAPISAD